MSSLTAQVPFWLQVSSVSLAPLLGFLGVGVGVWLRDRADRKTWLRQQRLDVYATMLELWNEYVVFVGTTLTAAMRSRDLGRIRKVNEDQKQFLARVLAAESRIRLVGTEKSARPAREFVLSTLMVSTYAAMSLGEEDFDQKSWDIAVVLPVSKPLTEFVKGAIADLGLPRQRLSNAAIVPEDMASRVEALRETLGRERPSEARQEDRL
jgi:hypothetical protein